MNVSEDLDSAKWVVEEAGVFVLNITEPVRPTSRHKHWHREALYRRVTPPMVEYTPEVVDVVDVVLVLLWFPEGQGRDLKVIVVDPGHRPVCEELSLDPFRLLYK